MNIRILYRTFFAFYILLTTGCDPEQESWDICKLNEHLGIDLPSSSIVLSASDGGGKRKDISYEHYFWTLYSPVHKKFYLFFKIYVKSCFLLCFIKAYCSSFAPNLL